LKLGIERDDEKAKTNFKKYRISKESESFIGALLLYRAEEAELAVIVEVAEEFFGASEISVSGLGEGLCDLCLLVRC